MTESVGISPHSAFISRYPCIPRRIGVFRRFAPPHRFYRSGREDRERGGSIQKAFRSGRGYLVLSPQRERTYYENRDLVGRYVEAEIIWKSFQLNPTMATEPGKGIAAYLVEKKGWSLDQIRKNLEDVTQSAAEMGLVYDFGKAVMANSFDAHRLVQLAKTRGLGDAMEERLFKAYFSEGGNIADHDTLARLAVDTGLPALDADAVAYPGRSVNRFFWRTIRNWKSTTSRSTGENCTPTNSRRRILTVSYTHLTLPTKRIV